MGVGCITSAFVLVNSTPDQSEWVLDRIKEIEGVEEAYRIWGIYDIVAEVRAEKKWEISGIVLQIRNVNHVLSTLTLRVVE